MPARDFRAWLLLLPALLLLAVIGLLPLLAVFNYGLHDIFTLTDVHWVGLEWFETILGSDRFLASLGRSLLFSALALGLQVPLGIAVAKLLVGQPRFAIWGLMLCAIPLVVPWNMIPILWLGMIDPQTGILGPSLASIGFDYKFTALHTWALILVMDTWHWLGLVVVLSYAGLSAIPRPITRPPLLTAPPAGRSSASLNCLEWAAPCPSCFSCASWTVS